MHLPTSRSHPSPPRIAVLALLAATWVGLLVTGSSALAHTYAPTRLGDPVPNGCKRNECSLREAVIAANNRSGDDDIVLKAGKTYKLSQGADSTGEDLARSGDLDIRDKVTIASSGKTKAIVDANNHFRVFETFAATALRRLKVKRGSTIGEDPGGLLFGGGLYSNNGGRTTIVRCAFTGNSSAAVVAGTAHVSISRSSISGNMQDGARAVSALSVSRSTISNNGQTGLSALGGELTVSRSTVAGNSPGVYVASVDVPTTITRSTITGNSFEGGSGGGIEVSLGTLSVSRSTVSGNKATGANANGGGIQVSQGTATLINDTIDGNHAELAGGGIYALYTSTVTMNAVTIAHNGADSDRNTTGDGGGIATDGTSTFSTKNSLIARNTAATGTPPDCSGTAASDGQNLLTSDNSGCPGFTGPADFLSVTAANLNLGTLRSNGGPTKTDALGRGSRAINHAGGDAPKLDQRGIRRVNPDIGAFERR
ncbi:MAG TPA: right-handed parallel beta-helix repeat-containing protein [Solirubrobacterales bacterium]|nr:right-handed parallel beta-helix repeat-containing protein [Solirubrobacterales bacterium]